MRRPDPLEKAIEMGDTNSDEVQERITKLHTLLRPHLLRRLKKDVEKELPKKYEHLVLCPLSKRQRFLYDEFMARRATRDALGSGVYLNIANVLMQLRKVCNHPDLFEVRPVITSFVISRSIAGGYTVVDYCVKHRSRYSHDTNTIPTLPGLYFIHQVGRSFHHDVGIRVGACASVIPDLGPVPPYDTRTIIGFKEHQAYQERGRELIRRMNIHMINRMRCSHSQIPLSLETIVAVRKLIRPIVPLADMDRRRKHLRTSSIIPSMVFSNSERAYVMEGIVERFAFATPPVVAHDLPRLVFGKHADLIEALNYAEPHLLDLFHRPAVKLQIGFPERALLQYDCGKLQRLHDLLRERKAGGHRVLIFTQMTKILDILESFLNLHGYLYLRLDGSTKIEDRQYITERFNNDARILCFISSSRSGGMGIK
jgi:helicase SWR1